MKLSTAKIYKMFGLDAYKEKYGEYIHDVETSLLEWQYQNVGEFVLSNPSMVAESNYIILVEIKNELWIRNIYLKIGFAFLFLISIIIIGVSNWNYQLQKYIKCLA